LPHEARQAALLLESRRLGLVFGDGVQRDIHDLGAHLPDWNHRVFFRSQRWEATRVADLRRAPPRASNCDQLGRPATNPHSVARDETRARATRAADPSVPTRGSRPARRRRAARAELRERVHSSSSSALPLVGVRARAGRLGAARLAAFGARSRAAPPTSVRPDSVAGSSCLSAANVTAACARVGYVSRLKGAIIRVALHAAAR
jgi:hypothetical protein